jgi:cytochrome P450
LRIVADLTSRYGDIVRYQTRFGPCFLFIHPRHVHAVTHSANFRRSALVKLMLGEGLLASDGAHWKSQRRGMQAHFLPQRMVPLVTFMAQETARTAQHWLGAARRGDAVDVAGDMTALTLRIVVRSLFSHELAEDDCDRLCNAVTQAVTELGRISMAIFGVQSKVTAAGSAEFAAARKLIDSLCYQMIAQRRAVPPEQRPADLLTLLMGIQSAQGPLSDLQLRDEIVTMLIGGHETTALALSWAWLEISASPDIESRLHQEADARPDALTWDTDTLATCVWSKAVFREALRLYPPVWSIARVAINDEVIDGHEVPAGAHALIPVWFTHRHPEFWPNPDRFDPSRFLDGAAHPPDHQAYLPFGGGRHICLGMHFGMLEGTQILAQLSQGFRLRPIADRPIRPFPGITLRQSPGLWAHVEVRSPAATERRAREAPNPVTA